VGYRQDYQAKREYYPGTGGGGWGGGVKVSVLMGEGEGGESPWQEWGEVKG
jgi:hypothetical protein